MIYRLSAAFAATLTLACPAAAQETNFGGFRIDGRLGWTSTGASATAVNLAEDPAEDGDELIEVSASNGDVGYGLEAGYDMMIGRSPILVGIYGGVDLGSTSACAEIAGDDRACAETDLAFHAGLRAGYVVSPALMVYAKGGYSRGDLDIRYDADVEDEDDVILDSSTNRNGFHLGGGFEIAFSRNFYGKLEYSYTDFGSATEAFDQPSILPGFSVGLDRHQAVAGLGFRF